jgi:tRNA threonylcarbamoyladenosine biosynthesis protein TsaB
MTAMTLALDTSTAAGSVAIADGARVLDVAAIDPADPVATRLPGDLVQLLARLGLSVAEIDVFAVATGPGSFTGLRIGIAAMQGLALATARPLVGISSFDALATFAAAPHVATWVDAWRGEVYASEYEDGREITVPIVAPPDVVLAGMRHADSLFIGDAAVRYRARLPRVVEPTPLLAGAVAVLAAERVAAGESPPPDAIRPLYVRRPDAELARERHA